MLLRNAKFCLSNHFYFFDVAGHLWSNLQTCKPFFGEKILNVTNVKLLSKICFDIFGFFMPFWWEWQLALYILSDFPGIKDLNGLNDLNSLNNLGSLNELNSLISSKNLYFDVKMYIFNGLLIFITWKRLLKVKMIQNS